MTKKPGKGEGDTRRRVGYNLKMARVAAGLLQQDVADALTTMSSGQSYVSRIERGEVNVTIELLEDLAAAVGVTAAQLLEPIPAPKVGPRTRKRGPE